MKAYYLLTILLTCIFIPLPLSSHGTHHTILKSEATCVHVSYHSDEPMGQARVLVFRPNESAPAWESSTDTRGNVCIVPDKDGIWVLQVRDKTGHGARINLDVNKNSIKHESTANSSLSAAHKTVMALIFIWGCIGTALFFKRNK